MAASAPLVRVRITIGSANDCSVRIVDSAIAEHHAVVDVTGRQVVLRNAVADAVTAVNGHAIDGPVVLKTGDIVQIGHAQLQWSGSTLLPVGTRTGARLAAHQVSAQTAGGKQLLNAVSVSIEPNQLVAIVGASGAGKTTLLRALAGIQGLSAGTITYDGVPLEQCAQHVQGEVGYVAQFNTVHEALTAREACRYAAQLRLPETMAAHDRETLISSVLRSVGLEAAADTRISNVSGGEAKRVGIAIELLSNPRVLLADEPTSGLDPMLDEQMMQLFRSLAILGRTVIVTTHSPMALESCDRILMLGSGGRVAYYGAPAAITEWFDTASIPSTYETIARSPEAAARRWAQTHPAGASQETNPGASSAPTVLVSASVYRPGTTRQLATLTHRYIRLLLRDLRYLIPVLLQAPVLGLLLYAVLERDLWLGEFGPGRSQTGAFSAVLVAVWLGLLNSSREIVKERAIVERERLLGIGIGVYLCSKLIPLTALTAIQASVLSLFVLARAGAPGVGTVLPVGAELFITVFLCGLASMGTGLVVSAVSRNEDGAGSLIPYVIIPQVLLGGVIFHLTGAFSRVEEIMITHWGTRAIDISLNVCGRANLPDKLCVQELGASYPSTAAALYQSWIVLTVIAGLSVVITAGILHTRRHRLSRVQAATPA